ncbi:hypothetical protein KIPB_009179 [Kipferlia bialata]|uniref:MIB/HERC2 domain-containing protein n=1 Tax=Kipferlia bialata TaxID=797122 RepID=A0A9K3CYZ7_9EUKA|nr:hypothetical protein KIPB_006136 [Kipferlia bialata]GIQ85938.1 hypothetical protein KIPB_007696 [Kipferlia bialata]GIQ87187.1 hypothetical protein KIPB_009179 [Kipferlia bialata]|eukprot:g6136.t1
MAGVGVILGPNSNESELRVEWEGNQIGNYRCGAQGMFDLVYAGEGDLSKYSHPRSHRVVHCPSMQVGAKVTRGIDWMWGNQDHGLPGVILPLEVDPATQECVEREKGCVVVQWSDGTIKVYRAGLQGKYDIAYVDTPSIVAQDYGTDPVPETVVPVKGLRVHSSKWVRGARVARGPDWKWGSHAGREGTGILEEGEDQSLCVRWSTGMKSGYRCGVHGVYGLVYTGDGCTEEYACDPAMRVEAGDALRVGATVVRGLDWSFGDQDGNGEGKVLGNDCEGQVLVKWENGVTANYRAGAGNCYDLLYVDTGSGESLPSSEVAEALTTTSTGDMPSAGTAGTGVSCEDKADTVERLRQQIKAQMGGKE